MDSATEMFDKAVELLRGAELLHSGAGNEHAALICAIHAGINAADAIGEHEGDPYRKYDHAGAADHLRSLDTVAYQRPAQSLRRLVQKKSTAEYRTGRFTKNQTADAISDCRVVVQAAADVLGVVSPTDPSTAGLTSLIGDLRREISRRGLDESDQPWNAVLKVLASL